MKVLRLFGFASGIIVLGSTTLASEDTTIRFTFSVPLSCSAETVSSTMTERGVALVVDEQCNSDRGYALYLDTTSDTIQTVWYDGQGIEVAPGRRTLLTRSKNARKHHSRIKIDVADGVDVVEAMIVIVPTS